MTSYFINDHRDNQSTPQLEALLDTPKVAKEANLDLLAQDRVTNLGVDAALIDEPVRFHVNFTDQMVLYADVLTVAEYLDTHQEWFQRCAQPMHTEPLGDNGYALTIGKFGALGYEVEPKIGLELLPQEGGIYHIRTIAIPDYTPPGYEVDFHAWQKLVEISATDYLEKKKVPKHLPPVITRLEWQLDLAVSLKFPRFLQKLPQSLIQRTGDRLLLQIIQLVNHRLTAKVQQDFQNRMGLSQK